MQSRLIKLSKQPQEAHDCDHWPQNTFQRLSRNASNSKKRIWNVGDFDLRFKGAPCARQFFRTTSKNF